MGTERGGAFLQETGWNMVRENQRQRDRDQEKEASRHPVEVRPRAHGFTSLCLGFSICEIGIPRARPPPESLCEDTVSSLL